MVYLISGSRKRARARGRRRRGSEFAIASSFSAPACPLPRAPAAPSRAADRVAQLQAFHRGTSVSSAAAAAAIERCAATALRRRRPPASGTPAAPSPPAAARRWRRLRHLLNRANTSRCTARASASSAAGASHSPSRAASSLAARDAALPIRVARAVRRRLGSNRHKRRPVGIEHERETTALIDLPCEVRPGYCVTSGRGGCSTTTRVGRTGPVLGPGL